MSDQLVYVYGSKSRVHLAVRHDGQMLTNERCQLDDVVGARIVVDSLSDVPDGHEKCARCFPHASVQDDAETVATA